MCAAAFTFISIKIRLYFQTLSLPVFPYLRSFKNLTDDMKAHRNKHLCNQ
jgi:hypothetical protein